MTTLMTQSQADAIRSVGEGAIVLWAMWVIDQNYPGRMTKAKELLPYLFPSYKDVRKLETQLNALCASGRLAQTSAGYVLLEGGKALFLEISGKDLALSPALVAGTEDQALVVDVVSADDEKFLSENTREMRAPLVVEVVDSTKNTLNNDSITPTVKSAQNVQNLGSLLLSESDLLFDGSFVSNKNLFVETLSDDYVLAVLAYCYAFKKTNENPSGFDRPAGMAYTMLKNNKKPRREYLNNPLQFLPDDFLEAVGLANYTCDDCKKVFNSCDALHEHQKLLFVCDVDGEKVCYKRFHTLEAMESHVKKEHKKTVEPKYYKLLDAENRGARAWKMVKDELQNDMPRASFDTWVRDAHAVFLENNQLTVTVRNAFACDWLNDRIKTKVNAMLEKFTNEKLSVVFVVGFVEGDE